MYIKSGTSNMEHIARIDEKHLYQPHEVRFKYIVYILNFN